ncbi:MAG: hypothetical protein FWB78_05080 [Treponema sp.]|nr:hypothetical protein [Treponema sp.]
MPNFASRRPVAKLFFIIGVLLLFLGGTFLIGSPPGISRVLVQIAFLLVAVGVGFAMIAVKISRRSLYIFLAGLFLQAGLFFFLSAIDAMPLGFARAWPLLSVFAGVAILPAGWHRYGAIRPNYVVLAAAFIILGSVLMVFSLDMVDFSFSQFILDWWPLLVVLAGIVLVLAALSSKLTGGFKK